MSCPISEGEGEGGLRGFEAEHRPDDRQNCRKNGDLGGFFGKETPEQEKKVVRGGLEPPTPAFSGPCSTN